GAKACRAVSRARISSPVTGALRKRQFLDRLERELFFRDREVRLLHEMPTECLEAPFRVLERFDQMRLRAVPPQLLRRPLGTLSRLGNVEERFLDLGEVRLVH